MITPSKTKSHFEQLLSEIYARRSFFQFSDKDNNKSQIQIIKFFSINFRHD